jgi:hypothetical protein
MRLANATRLVRAKCTILSRDVFQLNLLLHASLHFLYTRPPLAFQPCIYPQTLRYTQHYPREYPRTMPLPQLPTSGPLDIPEFDFGDPEDSEHDTTLEENIFRDMSLEDILEDLNARFLVNLPREEMTLVRVYWQAEQA